MFAFCSEPPGEKDIWGNGLWTLSRRFRLELKIPLRIRSGVTTRNSRWRNLHFGFQVSFSIRKTLRPSREGDKKVSRAQGPNLNDSAAHPPPPAGKSKEGKKVVRRNAS